MKKITEKIVYEGQWLLVQESLYHNKKGDEIVWETVHRKRSTTGVVVVARLMPSKRFILIKQFRPAINGYVLSFPAGLGFDNPAHALVELKEETGYTGVIKDVSPVLKAGASLINDSARVVYIEVDENLPDNQNPVQELEPAEDIEVCLVNYSECRKFLLEQQNTGIHISANLWYVFGLPEMLD